MEPDRSDSLFRVLKRSPSRNENQDRTERPYFLRNLLSREPRKSKKGPGARPREDKIQKNHVTDCHRPGKRTFYGSGYPFAVKTPRYLLSLDPAVQDGSGKRSRSRL